MIQLGEHRNYWRAENVSVVFMKIFLDMKILFTDIHVPYIPEQVIDKPDEPSMPIETIEKALEAIVLSFNM